MIDDGTPQSENPHSENPYSNDRQESRDRSANSNPELNADQQPLLAHLLELRRRVIIALVALAVGCGIGYVLAPHTYALLVKPLADVTEGQGRTLIYTGLAEAFVTYLKLALWTGFPLAFPVIIAQVWGFLAPGLYRHEKRALLPFLVASPVLFFLGAAMAWGLVFPLAWKFFLSFETLPATLGASSLGASFVGLPIRMEARVGEYLSLAMGIIMAFGLAFQLPVVLVLLVRAGLLTTAQLVRGRRIAIVLIFVVAAVITPPDVISQVCLALPLLVLYELAVLAARAIERGIARGKN